jgi:hypothetical protein
MNKPIEHDFNFGNDGQVVNVVFCDNNEIRVFIGNQHDDGFVFMGSVIAFVDPNNRSAIWKIAKRVIVDAVDSMV